MGSKRVPEVRFKGFSGEWEERKVKNISKMTFGGGTPKTKITEYWNGDIPWIQSSDLIENKVSNVDPKKKITELGLHNSAAKLIPMNSIAIVTRVGVGKIGLIQYEYTTSQDFLSLSQLKVNEWFAVYSLYNSLQKELHKVQGTSIKGITKNELLDKIIILPRSIEEQSQIGNFFRQLDETIAIQQQEIDTLRQTKQGFLQKMFPKEGESVPEIRFSGFSGEWEAKCLGEISESYSGGTPSVDNKTFYGGDIPFIRSAEINSKTTEIYITEEGFNSSSTKMVRVGDILYALYGATSGEVGISKINGAINQAVLAIKPKRGYDSYFLTQWLKKQKSSIINTYLQGGQGNLSGSIVKKLILKIPFDEKEQTEIGHFFKQLDKTIALHEQELDILKQTKKAFLQKMFV